MVRDFSVLSEAGEASEAEAACSVVDENPLVLLIVFPLNLPLPAAGEEAIGAAVDVVVGAGVVVVVVVVVVVEVENIKVVGTLVAK